MAIKLLILFMLVVFFKFISNYIAYLKCKKFRFDYEKWLQGNNNDFEEQRNEIISLIKRADIPDSHIPVSQAMNRIQIASHTASVLANFPTKHKQLAATMYEKFNEAVGVYRKRWKDAFSPLYWIETIAFLPKSIFAYVGVDLEKPALRLCNVLTTIIWWLLLFLFYLFGGNLYNYVMKFLTQL